MHPIIEKLLALSAGAAALTACRTVCSTPAREVTKTFAEVEERAPQVVAATYAELGIGGGTRLPSVDECVAACGPSVRNCSVYVRVKRDGDRVTSSEGSVTCSVETSGTTCYEDFDPLNLGTCPFGCGRLPAFVEARLRRRFAEPITQHFAEIAMLEALSVAAFAELARDLRGYGFASFQSRIADARRDERRHARRARAILRGLGALGERPPRVPTRRRTLEEIALGNAVDGCVRESFGAVVANVQARNARDPSLSDFFRSIAGDELRHAALSWDLHAALMKRLSPTARARVVLAQRAALAELEVGSSPHRSVMERAGAPTKDARRAMARAMAASLPYGAAA